MNELILNILSMIPPQTEALLVKIIIIISLVIVFYTLGTQVVRSIVAHFVRKSSKISSKSARDTEKRVHTLQMVFANFWRITVIGAALVYVASFFFSDQVIASVFTSAGFLGVALAFGAQSLVKDFLSGLFIVSENQYRVGDVIEVDNFGGTVEKIGARTTVIRDVSGNVHYFPNGNIAHVINKTMDYSKARLVISVMAHTEVSDAIKVINEVGSKLAKDKLWSDKIIEAPHYIMTGDISATGIDIIISGKVQPASQWSVTSELRVRLLDALEEAGIQLSVSNSKNGGATALMNMPQKQQAPKRAKSTKK